MTYLDDLAARIRAELPASVLPDEEGFDDLLRLYAVLARAKGRDVRPQDVHDAWVAWMSTREPEHPALIPFDQLDAKTQREDEPFLRAIRAACSRADA